jgi:putative ABC transport system permease protein
MLALALAVAFEGMGRANYDSMIDWMNAVLNPDLFVVPSAAFDMRSARFPASMAPEIAAVPGVEQVQMLRNARITFRHTPTLVLGVEMLSTSGTTQGKPVAGNANEMYRQAAAGEGLLVSDNFAQLQHLTLGQTLEVPAPYGLIRLPIVGIIVDYSDQQGAIMLDRSVFTQYWRDDSVNLFRVYTKRDVAVATVRQRILDRYAGQRQVFVLTNTELKGYIIRVLTQWFQLTSVQIGVAVLVAILGIINTLTVSIRDRRRELAVLRAVGATRGQVRRTIWIEALSVGTLGLVLGFVLGGINLYYTLEIVRRDVTGMRLDYHFPVSTVLLLIPTILAAALVGRLASGIGRARIARGRARI